MKKHDKTKLALLLTGLILIILTYFYYPNLDRNKIFENQNVEENLEDRLRNEQSTAFENVNYDGIYDLNKPFTIQAETAYILKDETEIVYMNNMHVIMNLSNGGVVNITSAKGRFNKETYDCFFEEDVKATDGETEIFAENLDLLATKNFIEAYNDVRLIYTRGSLKADIINYDFETKRFKVSMFDDKTVKMKVIKWSIQKNSES